MTPTSDERHEVAWRLRTEVSEGECIDYAVCRIINDVLGVNGAWGDKAARILADLIDPTCRAVHQGTSMDDELVCSECGASLGVEVDDEQRFIPKFCSCCGARVVSGDD